MQNFHNFHNAENSTGAFEPELVFHAIKGMSLSTTSLVWDVSFNRISQ